LINLIDGKTVIAQKTDEFGMISVVEFTNSLRYLYFGKNMEQSAVLTCDPEFLIYNYTRAMLLCSLLHPNPQKALFLGLGAGSLVKAALSILPLDEAEVIEIRQAVIDYAYEYFNFNHDLRLTVTCGDAEQLISKRQNLDLIFTDLYTVEGPSKANFNHDFIKECHNKLANEGWLIINQWSDDDYIPLASKMLCKIFAGNYWELPVTEGNVILIIPKNKQQSLNKNKLLQNAYRLKPVLNYSLADFVYKIRPASA